MAGVIVLEGVPESIARLASLPAEVTKALSGALYKEGWAILTDSQRLVPVETGTLRSSGTVSTPKTDGDIVDVEIGYGGAAQDYAIVQHERMDFQHPHGGQAKYLEQPALEHVTGMEARLGVAVSVQLNTGIK